jgi:hypothetical protein
MNCMNCGTEVVAFSDFKTSFLEEGRPEDDLPADEPTGGILVCPVCNMAADPNEEQNQQSVGTLETEPGTDLSDAGVGGSEDT